MPCESPAKHSERTSPKHQAFLPPIANGDGKKIRRRPSGTAIMGEHIQSLSTSALDTMTTNPNTLLLTLEPSGFVQIAYILIWTIVQLLCSTDSAGSKVLKILSLHASLSTYEFAINALMHWTVRLSQVMLCLTCIPSASVSETLR